MNGGSCIRLLDLYLYKPSCFHYYGWNNIKKTSSVSIVKLHLFYRQRCFVLEGVYEEHSDHRHLHNSKLELAATIDIELDHLAISVLHNPKIQPITVNKKT